VVLPLRGSFEGYLPSLRSGLTSQSGARAGIPFTRAAIGIEFVETANTTLVKIV